MSSPNTPDSLIPNEEFFSLADLLMGKKSSASNSRSSSVRTPPSPQSSHFSLPEFPPETQKQYEQVQDYFENIPTLSSPRNFPTSFRHETLQQYEQIPENISGRSTPKTPLTNPEDTRYYPQVNWKPINEDTEQHYKNRPFGRWATEDYNRDEDSNDWIGEGGSRRPKQLNCFEGVCYDAISRGALEKRTVKDALTKNAPAGTINPSYGERLLDVLDPIETRGTIPYDKLKDFNPAPGTTIFANNDRPQDHVFTVRRGYDPNKGSTVRSLWSKDAGTGNFSRSSLKEVLDQYAQNAPKEEYQVPQNIRYNTAFSMPHPILKMR